MYKIYNPALNSYSSGGDAFVFKKNGKVWSTIGALKGHLNLVLRKIEKYQGCEVHHYTEAGVVKVRINEFVIETIQRELDRGDPYSIWHNQSREELQKKLEMFKGV